MLNLHFEPFAVALIVAIAVTGVLSVVGARLGADQDRGVQKFHSKPTSRLGGVGIFAGLASGVWASHTFHPHDTLLGTWLLVMALPVFLGGLLEDLTHRVTPHMRLALAILSACIVMGVMQVGVSRTDIAPIDWVLHLPGAVFVLTVLVVAGFINAVNIIDGFHGLAAGTVVIMLLGLAGLAFTHDDALVMRLCLLAAMATLGFAVWNWPFGKIFLGDGGAYLLGLLVVVLGLMLPHRSAELSPMAPVLVGIYPLVETVYSMYRRKFLRSHPINHPDALHLHTLIYRRLMLNPALHTAPWQKNQANARVAVVVWCLALVPGAVALVFAHHTWVLLLAMAGFAVLYVVLYRRLVCFKAPPWLRYRTFVNTW